MNWISQGWGDGVRTISLTIYVFQSVLKMFNFKNYPCYIFHPFFFAECSHALCGKNPRNCDSLWRQQFVTRGNCRSACINRTNPETSLKQNFVFGCKHTHREKVMLRAADAIILDENFGPKAKEEKEKMPALHSTNLWVHIFILLFDCHQIDKKVGHLFLSIKGRSSNLLRRCSFNLESRWEILLN